jgi:hypothetical protein
MPPRRQRLEWIAALCLIFGPTTALGAPLTYSFTNIADTSDQFSGFFGAASVNSNRTVAFLARLRTGGDVIAVGNGETTAILYATGGEYATFGLTAPAINDVGYVAFVADLDSGGSGVFSGNGGYLHWT